MSTTTNPPARPLPRAEEHDTREFWTATRDRRLTYPQCRNCGTIVFYPRRHCTGCTSADLEWKTASGKGTVYTYSVVRQSYHPFFRHKTPYAVAWIDLDEGPRILSNIVGVANPVADVRIGMRVEVEWEEHEKLCIPLFRPA
ncbi:MAG: Zn-ribbon domain-containing OB-fold protein [Gammaproteobacteria bacterium]